MFVGCLVCWLMFYIFCPDVTAYPMGQRPFVFLREMNAPAIIFGCASVFIQIYAFVDAPVLAGKIGEKQKIKRQTEPE